MKKGLLLVCLCFVTLGVMGQTPLSPAITSWLQNTTQTGSYYVNGNSNAIPNNILVNCQQVEYSANFAYVTCTGIPAYPTGPFLDGNPSQAQNQNGLYQIPLNPMPNPNPQPTTGGNIGLFVNGVALFDYRDGVAWNPQTNALCGGPGNPPCPGGPMNPMDWNRDAIVAERGGFDCSKGHPAMGNYHHHQNPSAFKLDLQMISNVCNLYDADGLYAIDSTQHSPLIGFAYDGYPIYGAYAYKDTNGTGGIVRMRSGYHLRNISVRTHWADGTDVDDGPAVGGNYPIGYFREDYEFIQGGNPEDLDEHNGRWCVTPDYPNGTYAYFCTVDENWNSAYPYVVGPTFYGQATNRSINNITEPTTVYDPTATHFSAEAFEALNITVFPNPATDLIAIQVGGLVDNDLTVELLDITGKLIRKTEINKGQTIAYFDVQTVYAGIYLVKVSSDQFARTSKIMVSKE